jgi:hypothetical protein
MREFDMSQSLSLLFCGNIDESVVFERLYEPDSGFKPDEEQPLNSDVGVAVAIAGLVVSTAQLAIQLWRLWSEAKNAGKPISVSIVSRTGARIELPTDSKLTMERTLEMGIATEELKP